VNEFKAAVAFRLLGPRQGLSGPIPESLENIIIDPLPDGALCWVITEQQLYYLDKHSMAAVAPPDVIATSKGPGFPGRWVKFIPIPLAAGAPVNVNKSPAQVGVALSSARADHKHDIDTAAPVAVGIENLEGVATTLARSDHVHAPGPNPVCGPVVDGAFEELLPAGAIFPATDTWWTSPAKVVKLLETTYTRNAQNLVTQMQTVVYEFGLPVQIITDTITYSGMFVLNVSRSVV
jgi:hypothetical protein